MDRVTFWNLTGQLDHHKVCYINCSAFIIKTETNDAFLAFYSQAVYNLAKHIMHNASWSWMAFSDCSKADKTAQSCQSKCKALICFSSHSAAATCKSLLYLKHKQLALSF